MNPFASKLDGWRHSLGLDHRRFADHIGIDESYWSQLRSGRKFASRKLARRVIDMQPAEARRDWEFAYASDVVARTMAAPAPVAVVAA